MKEKKVSKKPVTKKIIKPSVTESPVVRTATYIFEFSVKADGSTKLKRTCDGFNGYELLGLLDLASREIMEQMKGGGIKPDIIERNVVRQK
jgi:hypothetical protein